MKNIFNHTKKPYTKWKQYEEENYDWDADYIEDEEEYDPDYIEDEEEYYAEETEPEYYAEDADAEEYYAEEAEPEYYAEDADAEEYYAEETEPEEYYTEDADAEEYYAEEAEPEEYYTEDVDAEEYYAEEAEPEYYAEDADAEEYYAEETDEEDDAYYMDEDDMYYAQTEEEARVTGGAKRVFRAGKRGNVFLLLKNKFLEMGTMDRMIAATGAAALVLALVTGSVYLGAKMLEGRTDDFISVGAQLEEISLIGEKGLMAVADAEAARYAAAAIVEEEKKEEEKEYNEAEYGKNVVVALDLTSVLKDLKVKFINKDSGKLVANVPFSVTVTDSSGKSETWTDDDMDGIIYKTELKAGKYKVAMNALSDEKYKDYTISTESKSVEVKKDIEYKKIDVKNEIKKESEVNASKEDTKKNETAVESVLEDTVQWVESTKTANTYVEVAKSTIADPATYASSKTFLRMAQNSVIPAAKEAVTLTPGQTALEAGTTTTVSAALAGADLSKGTWKSSNSAVATVAGTGASATITAVAAGQATISFTAPAGTVSGNDSAASYTGQCTITVTQKQPVTITLDKTAATVLAGEPTTITAKLTNAVAAQPKVTAESSNTGVATVSVSGTTITVNGVAPGSATITVSYSENGVAAAAVTCAVTVKTNPKNDKTNKLKDTNGRQLFVLEGETYREAVYADYYTASKFFIQGEAKYTGWQTLDGKLYFFDAAGNKVTGEQVIQGAKYNFASDGSLVVGSGTMGIDVSKWNGNIDWDAVKNSGVSYVIIRCGYRGSSAGSLIEDPKYTANIKGATAAGLKVGVYFFTQAINEVEAVEEASMVLEQVKNYKISYPIFLDVEGSGGRADGIDKATRTAVCKAFCNTIQAAGYTAGIYANKTWLETKMDAGSLSAYKIWLAQYASAPTYKGRYDLWQYKSTGKVSGIKGNVDMNLSYLGY